MIRTNWFSKMRRCVAAQTLSESSGSSLLCCGQAIMAAPRQIEQAMQRVKGFFMVESVYKMATGEKNGSPLR